MPLYTDHLHRILAIDTPLQRIISLVPSQTELLFDLGLDKEVIGITKFCIHPAHWFHNKSRIGGTKTVNIDRIKALNPDLIIANKEENVQGQVDQLCKDFPVWISDINTIADAIDMIKKVGIITNTSDKAVIIANQIEETFHNLSVNTPTSIRRSCYLIWKDPYMTVGSNTFTHDILYHAGFENIFASSTRYPTISISDIKAQGCDLLLLSSEPFPFKQKHMEELQLLLPCTRIFLVDGEAFSWYGSRLLKTPAYLKQLLLEIEGIS